MLKVRNYLAINKAQKVAEALGVFSSTQQVSVRYLV